MPTLSMLPSAPLPEPPPEAPPAAPPRPPLPDRVAAGIGNLLGWLPLAVAIGLAPGVTAWQLLLGDAAFLESNRLGTPERMTGAAWALGSLAAFTVLYAILGVVLVRRGATVAAALRRVNRWLFPLLAGPLVPWLALRGNETSRPFVTLLFALVIAATASVLAYRLPARAAPSRGRLAFTVVLAAAAGYAAALSTFSIRQHHAFYTQIFDLALYDNIFWQSIHGRPLATNFVRGGTHLAGHFDPILVLLSPLYLLYPRAELLLVLQSVWLALGAIPLFFLARRHLASPWAAAAVSLVYLLHPALQGANMYDFHSLALAIPLILLAVALLDAGRLRTYFVLLPLLLSVREDVSLLLCFVGLWAIVSRKAPRSGFATIAVSLLYFVGVKALLMRTGLLNEGGGATAHSYAYYYRDLIPNAAEGSPGLFLSLLINPVYALSLVFSEAKVLYLARMLLPVLFLPLLAGHARWMLVFGLVSVLLASKPPMFSLYFQYVATILPLALALAPMGARALAEGRLAAFAGLEPRRLVGALAAGMLAAGAVVSAEYGVFLPNEAFRAGFSRFARDPSPEVRERYRWLREQLDALPPGVSVAATRRLVPHVSNRGDVLEFPGGRGYEYLLLEPKVLDARARKILEDLLKAKAYETVADRGDITLYRRAPAVPLP